MRGNGITDESEDLTPLILDETFRACRTCQNFYRIGESFRKLRWRGFCIVGQLDGDFSLYISSSTARTCEAYLGSEYNLETERLENDLSKTWDEVIRRGCDKRSKIYKEIMKFQEGMEKVLEYEVTKHWVFTPYFDPKFRTIAFEYFFWKHKTDFERLHARASIPETGYAHMLGNVTLNLNRLVEKKYKENEYYMKKLDDEKKEEILEGLK